MWPLVQTRIQAWSAFTNDLRDLALSLQSSGMRSPGRGKRCGHGLPAINQARSLDTLGHPTRYDFFYKNGVPKWRGTGYYYSRFRPGVGVRTYFRLPYDPHTLITSISPIPDNRKKTTTRNADGLDVPCLSHDGVAIHGPTTELHQRFGTNRKDQARCENNSVGKSIGATGGPKEGKCNLDGMT